MASQSSSAFLFIDSSEPSALKDRQKSRAARSHAVSVALARQRRRAQEKGENFRGFTQEHTYQAAAPSRYLGMASVDPFETLPINARRLTTLLHLRRSLCAGEPVFNANDAIHFQSLQSVFRTGLTNGPLTAALGLTLCYANNGRTVDREYVKLNSIALQHLQTSLSEPTAAAMPSIIGSILLLLGAEYRLGDRRRAQAHLKGIQALLDLCIKENMILPSQLRRAIYWQDLFCSIFVQTDRIVHYGDFHPGQQSPRLHLSSLCDVPEGFAPQAARLGRQFTRIVSDVAALYRYRPQWLDSNRDGQGLERLCNTQAELEGRLHGLRQSASDDLLISCAIATFLCVYAFWTDIWNTALVPRCLSTQLLHHVYCWQRVEPQLSPDLLFWLVHVGKAFAVDAHVRHSLDEILKSQACHLADLTVNDSQAQEVLHSFIWSDVFYQAEVGWFWQQIDEEK